MAALTANKDVLEMDSAFAQLVGSFGSGVAVSSDEFYIGALVVYDPSDDKIKPGATDTGLFALGRCEERLTTGAGFTGSVRVRSGIFKFDNSASADEIANDDFGKTCYIVDDQTVALTDGSASRSAAGKVVKVDTDGGVYVAINPLG